MSEHNVGVLAMTALFITWMVLSVPLAMMVGEIIGAHERLPRPPSAPSAAEVRTRTRDPNPPPPSPRSPSPRPPSDLTPVA